MIAHPNYEPQIGFHYLMLSPSQADTRPFVESVNAMGGSAKSVALVGSGHYISEEAVLHPVCIAMLQSIGIEIEIAGRGVAGQSAG